MKSIMILGAGPLQVPAIKVIKNLGYKVIACDYDKDAVGFKYADVPLIVSTIDRKAVLEQARIYNPDYILTSTSDAPVKTVAYVSEILGKKIDISYKDAICATEKDSMRKRLLEYEVPIPKFYICYNFNDFTNALKEINGFCVVKPSDNAASRGVKLFDSTLSLEKQREQYEYTKSYSRNGLVLVEEFMKGTEVSVEGLIQNKILYVVTITDKITTPLPYFVEIGHSEPSSLSKDIQKEIIEVARKATKAIGIINGSCHAELIITNEGPKIVEIAARLGGDYITSKLVPLSTGVDMIKNSVLLAIGNDIDLLHTRKNGSCIKFIYGRKGVIKSIYFSDEIKNINGLEEIELYVKAGDRINDLQNSNDRLGHVITTGKTANDAIRTADQVLSFLHLEID